MFGAPDGCRRRLACHSASEFSGARSLLECNVPDIYCVAQPKNGVLFKVLQYWRTTMAERTRERKRPSDLNVQLLLRELDDALWREGTIPEFKEMRPREFVDLMTRSSFEIGRILKRALRDALYQQRRDASKKWSRARRGTDT